MLYITYFQLRKRKKILMHKLNAVSVVQLVVELNRKQKSLGFKISQI